MHVRRPFLRPPGRKFNLLYCAAKTALNNIQKLKAKTDSVVRDMQKVRSHLIIPPFAVNLPSDPDAAKQGLARRSPYHKTISSGDIY